MAKLGDFSACLICLQENILFPFLHFWKSFQILQHPQCMNMSEMKTICATSKLIIIGQYLPAFNYILTTTTTRVLQYFIYSLPYGFVCIIVMVHNISHESKQKVKLAHFF